MNPTDSLDQHKHLLDGSWQSAADVTKRVCWDLRAEYALIRKTGGTRCAGPGGDIDCDKVVHRQTFDVYDCVAFAGSPQNAVAWIHEGRHPDLVSRLVEPEPYEGQPTPTPVPPPTPAPVCQCSYDPAALVQLRAEVAALYALVAALSDELMEQREDLAGIRVAVEDVREALRNGLAIEGSVSGLRYVGQGRVTGEAKG